VSGSLSPYASWTYLTASEERISHSDLNDGDLSMIGRTTLIPI
jgi:hypothetical protein